jgi:hypothetical protein
MTIGGGGGHRTSLSSSGIVRQEGGSSVMGRQMEGGRGVLIFDQLPTSLHISQ